MTGFEMVIKQLYSYKDHMRSVVGTVGQKKWGRRGERALKT